MFNSSILSNSDLLYVKIKDGIILLPGMSDAKIEHVNLETSSKAGKKLTDKNKEISTPNFIEENIKNVSKSSKS